MKNFLILIASCVYSIAFAQEEPKKRFFSTIDQEIEISTDSPILFELTASVKVIPAEKAAAAKLWVLALDENDKNILYLESEESITEDEWKTYTLRDTLKPEVKKITFGGMGLYDGQFYFDHFQLKWKNDSQSFENINIQNASFEKIDKKGWPKEWFNGKNKGEIVQIQGFTTSVVEDAFDGKKALLIEGKGVEKRNSSTITSVDGYTPQIGAMVAMLDNLKDRVERVTKTLDQRQVDHLFDENANSIGALILHLAAAEAYYQVNTFENREFNEEEKKLWMTALDLDEKGRQDIKGHPIEYYMKIFTEVRNKTKELLKNYDDEWLNETNTGSWGNNYFKWFHVMEHQSSHLGQILMLKKRLPEKENKIEITESVD